MIFSFAWPCLASEALKTKTTELLTINPSALRFENLNSTNIDIYYNNNILNKEKILQFFLDARPLIKTEFYPTNFKLKIYKYIDGKQIVLKVLNKNIKIAKSAQKSIFLTDLNLVSNQEDLYLDLYDTNDNLYGSYKIAVNFENQTEAIVNNTENIDCDLDEPDCLLKFIFEKVNFSASFDNKLITEVSRLESGNYSVIIPVKKGRKLRDKVKNFNFISEDGGKSNGKGNSNSGYYPYFNISKEEVASSTWNEDDSSVSFSTASLENVFQIFSNNTVAIRSKIKQGLLNIGASNEGRPNIVFEPGSLSTSLIDGALEYDGSQLYFTSNGSRIALGSGSGAGIPGPAGPTGPTGPQGPGGTAIDLSNGGFLNGVINFTNNGMIQNAFLNGSLQYIDGNQAAGRVLTSDALGNATWQVAPSGGASSNGTLGAIQLADGSGGFNSDSSNFYWNNTNDYAVIGSATLYETAIGIDAAANNTGNSVNALGYAAASNNTGSSVNALGDGTASSNTGSHVNAMGESTAANNAGDHLNALGFEAAANNTGFNVNAIGQSAAFSNTGNYVNAIGLSAATNNTGQYLNAIGFDTANNNKGDQVQAIGTETLYNNNGDYNIALGYRAGYNTRNGSENIMIGRGADVANPNLNKQINIGNTIYGGNGRLAIGIVKPLAAATLELNGSFLYRDGNQALGRVLTSDALGNATWQVAPSGGASSSGTLGAIQLADGSGGFNSDSSNFYINTTNGYALLGNYGNLVTAIGYQAAGNTSTYNVNAIGSYAAYNNIGEGVNTIGAYSAYTNTGENVNVIGSYSGYSNTGHDVNAFGFEAARINSASTVNAFGNEAARENTGSLSNVFGQSAAHYNAGSYVNAYGNSAAVRNNGNYVNAFGHSAASLNNGDHISAFGYQTLAYNNGDYNIAIGYQAGYNTRNGSGNIMIGRDANVANPNLNKQINIGNTIYGGNGRLAIGIVKPLAAATLELNGSFLYRDGNQALGRVLTSDALGNATWQVAPSGGDTNGQVFIVNNNIISNNGSSADYQDDFVIGSPSLADTGIAANDSRMFFDKSKGAFRAGSVNSSQWNDANIGNYSVAFGTGNIASGGSSIAWGTDNTASTDYSTVWGENNTASGDYSTSWGSNNITAGDHTTTWGTSNLANNTYATAWGQNNIASGETTTVFGRYVEAAGDYSIAFGSGNSGVDRLINTTNQSLKIGFNSNAATLFVGPSAGGSTTGYVGIGTSTPARKLHISEAMRLEPQASPPASPSTGDLYVDSDGLQALCIYLNGAWVVAAGAGACG